MTTHQTVRDSVTVVTGATRGLGRALALELARRGARVVAVGRSTADAPHRGMPGTLEGTRADLDAIGGSAITIRADFTDSDQVESVVARTLEWAGRCDILVN